MECAVKAFRIALAIALLGAAISFLFAFCTEYGPFFLSLTAFFLALSFLFGLGLLILLIFGG